MTPNEFQNLRLKKKIAQLPLSPGVYLFKDKNGIIIYVGKALMLKRRVSSYFYQKHNHSFKTMALLNRIDDVDVILCESETQAFIKENDLIKTYQPRYNIELKDDKTYPWIKITGGDLFPRISITRQLANDNAMYYGPYPRANYARKLLDCVIKTYHIRDCHLDIREGHLYESCLSLQLQCCDGPCLQKISSQRYKQLVKKACQFLEGKQSEMISLLKKEMDRASQNMNFELASEKRDLIVIAKQIHKGSFLKKIVDTEEILSQLKKTLSLKRMPYHIECFDVSHISGTHNVAAMTVFENAKPIRKKYRFFKIKTVSMNNDFACLSEALERRYRKCLEKKEKWPDLLVIDGGKGQLSSIPSFVKKEAVKRDIIALAKRFEWIYVLGNKKPFILPERHAGLSLLKMIRDETHQSAVGFHRSVRSRQFLSSPLLDIKGIGPILEKKLLQQFKTSRNISKLSIETLSSVEGISSALAKKIKKFFSHKNLL